MAVVGLAFFHASGGGAASSGTTAAATPSTTLAAQSFSRLLAPSTTAVREQEGRATFHHFDSAVPGGPQPCAHRTIRKGTVVTVTDLTTGASTTCVVTDRGPYGDAIIDLNDSAFAALGDPNPGRATVRLTW